MQIITVYRQHVHDHVEGRDYDTYTLEDAGYSDVRHKQGSDLIMLSKDPAQVTGYLQAPDDAQVAFTDDGDLRLWVGKHSWSAAEIIAGAVASELGSAYRYRSA